MRRERWEGRDEKGEVGGEGGKGEVGGEGRKGEVGGEGHIQWCHVITTLLTVCLSWN